MEIKLLELHFAQLAKTWSKSKFNNYSDSRKQAYRNKLAFLFDKLQVEDFASLSPSEVQDRSYVIDFFFTSLEFLDSSTLNLMPFEIVECLSVALKDWLDRSEDYIIVTSLVNEPVGFSFRPELAITNFYYDNVKSVYGIDFSQRLIQITLPRFLVRDYLANVVLYHELGHFIDLKYNIALSILSNLCNIYFNTSSLKLEDKQDIETYFPYIDNLKPYWLNKQQLPPILISHIREYFCDIFASQYIGECSNYYLDYITKKQSQFGSSHPSTTNRVNIVKDFLLQKSNSFTINLIKNATDKITGKKLETRYDKVVQNEFYDLLPCVVTNEKQLHNLFILGWETWLGDWNIISEQNNMNFDVSSHQVNNIINNLIEKSINSFIVKRSWEQANAVI